MVFALLLLSIGQNKLSYYSHSFGGLHMVFLLPCKGEDDRMSRGHSQLFTLSHSPWKQRRVKPFSRKQAGNAQSSQQNLLWITNSKVKRKHIGKFIFLWKLCFQLTAKVLIIYSWALDSLCIFLKNSIPEGFALIQWELLAERDWVHPGCLQQEKPALGEDMLRRHLPCLQRIKLQVFQSLLSLLTDEESKAGEVSNLTSVTKEQEQTGSLNSGPWVQR